MDWQAGKAREHLAQTGRMTVVVQDNYSVHHHHHRQVQEKRAQWQAQGLCVFFLPVYSPELNRIEGEWHQVKAHRMQGRSFGMEYEVAFAVIEAIEDRYREKGYACERYPFN